MSPVKFWLWFSALLLLALAVEWWCITWYRTGVADPRCMLGVHGYELAHTYYSSNTKEKVQCQRLKDYAP